MLQDGPYAHDVFGPDDARGIAGVSWDWRQTLCRPDTERIAEVCSRHGVAVQAEDLERAQCYALWAAETTYADRASYPEAFRRLEFPLGWGESMRQLVRGALFACADDPSKDPGDIQNHVLLAIWKSHCERHLWRTPDRNAELALELLFSRCSMGIVSNDEGKLLQVVREVGFDRFFQDQLILDSHIEGVAKPEREIFVRLAERMGEDASRIIHIGNQPTFDVHGALDAGMRAALYDPHHLWDRTALPKGVKRVRSLVSFAELITLARRPSPRPNASTSSSPPSI